MFKVIFGEDRLAAEKAVKATLGADYEVFEGENLTVEDLPSIFWGNSLFSTGKRKILLKNLSENAAVWEKVGDYQVTEHDVVVWEGKIDKRSAGYKRLKADKVEMQECVLKQAPEMRQVFQIFDTAWVNGERAVRMVEQIELQQDPYMFLGLLVTQALKRFEMRQGRKEKAVIRELAKVDMQMKTTDSDPWMVVKAFLLQVATF